MNIENHRFIKVYINRKRNNEETKKAKGKMAVVKPYIQIITKCK